MKRIFATGLMLLVFCGVAGAATYYVNPSTGNDAVASAAGYDVAYDTGTLTSVTKTGAFASYTWHIGDEIYITGGTGAKTGYFIISSRNNDDSIEIDSYADGEDYDCDNTTLAFGNDGTTTATSAGTLHGPTKTITAAYALVAYNDDTCTVSLADGNYDMDNEAAVSSRGATDYLNINYSATVTIQGASGVAANVTLTGKSAIGYVVQNQLQSDKTMTLKNLTIVGNNNATGLLISEASGGHTSNTVLNNVVITNSTAGGAYCICLEGGVTTADTLTLTNCTLSETAATGTNCGIYVHPTGSLSFGGITLTNSPISVTSGYGIETYVGYVCPLTFTSSTVTANNIALYMLGSGNISATSSTFTGSAVGGITVNVNNSAISTVGTLTFTGCTVNQTAATGANCGMYFDTVANIYLTNTAVNVTTGYGIHINASATASGSSAGKNPTTGLPEKPLGD
jgi:hypothetical protein